MFVESTKRDQFGRKIKGANPIKNLKSTRYERDEYMNCFEEPVE